MKRQKLVLGYTRRFLPVVAGSVAAASVLLYSLVPLAPHLSPGERQALAASRSLASIVSNPLFAPHKLLLWLIQFTPHGAPVWLVRLPSVILACVALGLFAYILQRWYGRRSMLFGFLILLCSATYLHVARFGGFEIDYLAAIVSLLAVHLGINDYEDNAYMWFAWLVVNLVLLFVPGMAFFVLLNVVWQFRSVWTAILHMSLLQRMTSAMLVLATSGAIAYPLVRHSQLAFTWLGIPASLAALRHVPSALGQTALALAYRGPHNPEIWLGTLPLLDVFLMLMFLAGAFFYAKHWRAARTHLLAGYIILGVLLISFGTISYALIVPLLYVVAVAGIAYALHYWLGIFPRNPLAHSFGIAVVACVVAISCYYGLAQYFIAWPHNSEVVAIYRR